MFPRRFRIIDLIAVVALAALGATIAHDNNIYTNYDPTFVICPVAVSTALIALMAATIAAWYGRGSRRAFWWGFAFVGWTYLALSVVHVGFDFRVQPFPSLLFSRAMRALGEHARGACWTATVQATEYLGYLPGRRFGLS
jgi:hypothetical protein